MLGDNVRPGTQSLVTISKALSGGFGASAIAQG